MASDLKQDLPDDGRISDMVMAHSGTGEEVIQAYADGLKKGLVFIDKYKAESEGPVD